MREVKNVRDLVARATRDFNKLSPERKAKEESKFIWTDEQHSSAVDMVNTLRGKLIPPADADVLLEYIGDTTDDFNCGQYVPVRAVVDTIVRALAVIPLIAKAMQDLMGGDSEQTDEDTPF